MDTVWICGHDIPYDGTEWGVLDSWILLGVYTTKEQALARCKDGGYDFVAEVELDKDIPSEEVLYANVEYPYGIKA